MKKREMLHSKLNKTKMVSLLFHNLLLFECQRYTNADLKISLYVWVRIKA